MYNFKNLCPFKWFVLQNFPFIEADFDAITNWQLFCKLGEEINKIITKVNLTGKQVEDLTNAFNELQEYVENYFENLDVQDEIDNKLDEMVESGELGDIINQHLLKEIQKINSISNIAFLSPSPELRQDFGDCAVITGNKNIIMDIGNETTAQTLISYLFEHNITKIDYIVISHYHNDHIGGSGASGLIALLSQSNIDFSNCTVLLPHKNINYGLFVPISENNPIRDIENTIINILNTNNINYHYPDNEEIITINDYEQLQFFNIGSNFYTDYYNITKDGYEERNSTIYNNFSMVTEYKHFENSFWFTGDIQIEAQKNIYQYIKNCDVLKVEHHGVNRDSYILYLGQLYPKFAFVGNRQYYPDNHDFMHVTVSNLLSKNCKVFSSRYTDNVIITSLYDNIICDNPSYLQNNITIPDLYCGQIIPEGADLNDYIIPGTYFCDSALRSQTLLNVPVYNHTSSDNTDKLNCGFKLIVMNTTDAKDRLAQIIITSNNKRKSIAIRLTYSGSFEDTAWAYFAPSEDIHYLDSEFIPLIDTLENDITILESDTQAYKLNMISTINIAFHTNEEIVPFTDILLIPKYIVNLTHNMSFVLTCENDDKCYGAYLHSYDSDYMSLRVRTTLPTNKNFFGSVSCVNRGRDNL